MFEQLILSLKSVNKNFLDVIQSADDQLSQGHQFLLFRIYHQGSIKTTDISSHFGITPGAATGIADKLDHLGLIMRERDQKDRRVVVISLSERGIEYVKNKKKKHIRLLEEILTDFSQEEIEDTIQKLNKISNAMHQYQTSRREGRE